jgi:hypothetical protein
MKNKTMTIKRAIGVFASLKSVAGAGETVLLVWDFDPIDTAAGPAHRE